MPYFSVFVFNLSFIFEYRKSIEDIIRLNDDCSRYLISDFLAIFGMVGLEIMFSDNYISSYFYELSQVVKILKILTRKFQNLY